MTLNLQPIDRLFWCVVKALLLRMSPLLISYRCVEEAVHPHFVNVVVR
jgi:hypothetical protein